MPIEWKNAPARQVSTFIKVTQKINGVYIFQIVRSPDIEYQLAIKVLNEKEVSKVVNDLHKIIGQVPVRYYNRYKLIREE